MKTILLLALCAQTVCYGQGKLYMNGNVIVDEPNNLQWLRLTFTQGLSYNQALAATQPGQPFDTFRFATEQEVNGLYNSAGITERGTFLAGTTNYTAIVGLALLLGPTYYQQGHPESFGIFLPQEVGGLDFGYFNGVAGYLVTPSSTYLMSVGLDYSNPTLGNFLVREIPEPTPALFLVSLVVIYLLRRQR